MEVEKLSVGLDKIDLSNVRVIGVQCKKLLSNRAILELGGSGLESIDFDSEKDIIINEMLVTVAAKDNERENAIQISINKQKGLKGYYYTALSFNAPKLFERTNETNISEEVIVSQLPQIIAEKLANEGVFIDIEKATIKACEINTNIVDNGAFKETYELIKESWKNEDEKVFLVDSKKGYESMKCNRATRKLKIYDKARELREQGYEVENEITRIEVSTSHATTLKQLLKDDISFINFCNSFETMQKYYKKVIKDDIQKPVSKFIGKLEDEIFNELEKGKKPYKIYEGYINDKQKRNLIVDLVAFDNAITKYYKKNKKKNLSRDIKNFHERILKKTNLENYNKLVNNMERIEQLVENI